MLIRNTTHADIDAVMEIYAAARQFMRECGNANQWGNGHPARELIEADVENKTGYVVEENGEIIGAFFFKIGDDPTYRKIEGGAWMSDAPYAVIHRIAVSKQGCGIIDECINYCFAKCPNLRIDTHEDNLPMQKALTKRGFSYCGIIYLENGEKRLAYQKNS